MLDLHGTAYLGITAFLSEIDIKKQYFIMLIKNKIYPIFTQNSFQTVDEIHYMVKLIISSYFGENALTSKKFWPWERMVLILIGNCALITSESPYVCVADINASCPRMHSALVSVK